MRKKTTNRRSSTTLGISSPTKFFISQKASSLPVIRILLLLLIIIIFSAKNASAATAIYFTNPTDNTSTTISRDWSYVNVTVTSTYNTSAFIDWNRSLIGWWSFESNNSLGIYDNSTYNNFATFRGTGFGSGNITTGKYGNGLNFDGTNDYLNIGNPSILQINGSMTITAWIYERAYSSGGADNDIFSKSYYPSSMAWQFKTTEDCGAHQLAMLISASGNDTINYAERCGNTTLNQNTWYYVVGVYNAQAQTLDLYLNGMLDNGVLDGTIPSTIFNSTWNASIGRRYNTTTSYWNGTIDEVRVFNRVLSPEEINASFNAGAFRLYHNFINLTEGTYNFTAYAIDELGNINKTEERTITYRTTVTANISLNLDPNPASISQNVSIYGHLNLSNGTNISNNKISIYINNSLYYVNDNSNQLINTTLWLDSNYDYRTKINIISLVTTNLNNTIVLVNLSTSDLISAGKMNSDCSDTRFTDNNSNELQYTMETSTCNTTNTIYWVWMNLTGNANTTIYAYYGNSAATLPLSYTNPDTSLKVYWHLDNSEAYGEDNSLAYDYSKNNNNGVISGATPNESGRYGGGYSFDGDKSNITAPSVSDITNISGTMMAWFKRAGPGDTDSGEYIINARPATNDRYYLYTTHSAGTIACRFGAGAEAIMGYYQNNTWYHVAAVWNNGQYYCYLNGNLSATGTYSIASNPTLFRAGRLANLLSYFFNGSIDEVRIYNRSLPTDEILSIYNSTAPNYIQNNSLPRTGSNGDYNYTWNTSAQGNYGVKVNATYIDGYAEASAILTIGDLCTYSGSGDWTIQCSNSCNISSNTNLYLNKVIFNGTGIINITANITNWTRATAQNSCKVIAYSGGGLKK